MWLHLEEWLSRCHHRRTVTVQPVPRLEADLAVWRELEQRCPGRSVFASAEYLALWYRHYGEVFGEGRLTFGFGLDGRARAGAAWLRRRGHFGGIPLCRLDLAGFDGASGELLAEPGEAAPAAVADLVCRLAQQEDWHLAEIENVPPEAPWLETLLQTAEEEGIEVERCASAFATVDLRAGAEAHWQRLEGKIRRNLKRARARAEAAGRVAVEGLRFFDPPDPAAREAVLARAERLTNANPKMRAAGRPLSSYYRRFYAALAEHYHPRGQFDLAILTIDGQDAAFVMALVENGIYYDVTVSYHEAFKSVFPGINLMYRLIETLPAYGVHTVVSHGAHDYKRNWASDFRPVWTLRLVRRSWRVRMARLMRQWRALLGPRRQTPAASPRPAAGDASDG
jgi:CelD/BcsL family acetyltransferase involved in cellulose biosynthesis